MNTIDSELTETITSDTEFSTSTTNITSKPLVIKLYSHNDKKQLVKRMNDIKNKKCYIKIFKVIHRSGSTKYTVNDNGVLFNLTILPDDILTNIELIIQYYENKKNINESHLKNISNNKVSNDTEDNMSSDIMDTIKTKKQTQLTQLIQSSSSVQSVSEASRQEQIVHSVQLVNDSVNESVNDSVNDLVNYLVNDSVSKLNKGNQQQNIKTI